VFPGAQRLLDKWNVERVRGADVNDVHVGGLDEILGRFCYALGLDSLLKRTSEFEVMISNSGNYRSRGPSRFRVNTPYESGTNNCCPDARHGGTTFPTELAELGGLRSRPHDRAQLTDRKSLTNPLTQQ
jgi:hypothetical protein